MKKPQAIGIYLVLLLLAWHQTIFLQHSLKWDALDTLLPWRYYMGECLRNGYFPFWLPFQQMGYPLHADVRSVWNPEALFTSFFASNTLTLLHWLLPAYLLLAGLGMRQMLIGFNRHINTATLFGAVYMLNGYMVSQAQDLPRIAAAALLPWVVNAWLKLREHPLNIRAAISFALWQYFMFTSGYQALSIMLSYLFLVLFISEQFPLQAGRSLNLFKGHSLAYGVLLLLCAPIVYSIYQSSAYVGRFNVQDGLSAELALGNPFSPACFLSFLAPSTVTLDLPILKTDISMRNAFLGTLMLGLWPAALWRLKKHKTEAIVFIFGSISALAALGHHFPLRLWLYEHLPLMNMFKTPAYFIVFFQLAWVLALSAVWEQTKRIHFIYTLALGLTLTIWGYYMGGRWGQWVQDIHPHAFHTRLALHGLATAGFSFLALLFNNKTFWSVLIISELLLATILQMPVTATHAQSPKFLIQYFHYLPMGFHPQPQQALELQTDMANSYAQLYRNNSLFNKRISAEGFNSFYFDKLHQLEADTPIYRQLMSLTPAFWADSLFTHPEFGQMALPQKASWQKAGIYKFLAITPNTIEPQIKRNGWLVLQQSAYPGWKVYLDGHAVKPKTINHMQMGIWVPKNTKTVVWKYKNTPLIVLSILSFSILGCLLILQVKNQFGFKITWISLAILTLGIGLKWGQYQWQSGQQLEEVQKLFQPEIKPNVPILAYTERASHLPTQTILPDWRSPEDLPNTFQKLCTGVDTLGVLLQTPRWPRALQQLLNRTYQAIGTPKALRNGTFGYYQRLSSPKVPPFKTLLAHQTYSHLLDTILPYNTESVLWVQFEGLGDATMVGEVFDKNKSLQWVGSDLNQNSKQLLLGYRAIKGQNLKVYLWKRSDQTDTLSVRYRFICF